MQIRRAGLDDAASIASLLNAAFVEYEPSYTPEAYAATTPTHDRIQQRMSEGPVWVAMQGDTLVGTVSAVPKEDALYLRSMAVLPMARGRGIGKSLLEEVETFARSNYYRRLLLSTTPFLDRAIRLYEQFGF